MPYDEKEAYQRLETLIQERQKFEADHPYPPYTTYPTTIDYTDIDGKTLLSYACGMGDLEKVKFCISKDANIQKAQAMSIALREGHLDVVQYLYARKTECFDVELCDVSEAQGTKAWFKEK